MKWLKVGERIMVNLDHIACGEIIDLTPIRKNGDEIFHVVLYPISEESEQFKVCEGSRSKCEDYLRALGEYVGCKQIIAVGEHQCQCACGCQEIIREDFLLCDNCEAGFHNGEKYMQLGKLKKDAE